MGQPLSTCGYFLNWFNWKHAISIWEQHSCRAFSSAEQSGQPCLPQVQLIGGAQPHQGGPGQCGLSSVQLSRSVLSDSLLPHGLQHTRLPCPSPTPGACSNSCSLSQWCHPTISSSVVPFSSCPQFFPESGSFPRSPFFASGGQSIGVSASA